MTDWSKNHSPACTHLTVSARRFMAPDACGTCRAYQLGLSKWAARHTGTGQPDDGLVHGGDYTGRWCECGEEWPCYDYKMLLAAGWREPDDGPRMGEA